MPLIFRTSPVPLFLVLGLFGLSPSANAAEDFAACRQFFANGNPPVVSPRPTDRALCFDAFAVLHSGQSKTPVFVAEKLNRAAIADAGEKRTDKFFANARLRSAERNLLKLVAQSPQGGSCVKRAVEADTCKNRPVIVSSNCCISAMKHSLKPGNL